MIEEVHDLDLRVLKSTGSPAIDCKATIYVELPNSYVSCQEKTYPVCYVFDGEFISTHDDRVGLHEMYVVDGKAPEVIYVGISLPLAGADRTSVLGAPVNSTFFLVNQERGDVFMLAGKGDYLFSWISKELKPYIDSRYRTKRKAADTAVLGWSSGGSGAVFAAMLAYNTFTRVGSFSPATWVWDTWLYGAVENAGYRYDYVSEDGARRLYTTNIDHITHLFMYQGGEDGSAGDAVWAMNSAKAAYGTLIKHGAGSAERCFLYCQEGTHCVESWRPYLSRCIYTLFPDYIKNI